MHEDTGAASLGYPPLIGDCYGEWTEIGQADWKATTTSQEFAQQVLVTGVPNALLSDSMMQVVLEQSGYDSAVWSFEVYPDKYGTGGKVVISMANAHAAERVMKHFQGRPWGGHVLSAEILPAQYPRAWHWPDHEDAERDPLAIEQDHEAQHEWPSESPPIPASLLDPSSKLCETMQSGSSWLEEATTLLEKEGRAMPLNGDRGFVNSSNASTRDGCSESGEEAFKDGALSIYQ